MKLISNYSIGSDHCILIYDNNNNNESNYDRFISVVRKDDKKSPLIGTTTKSTNTKEDYVCMGRSMLQRYFKYLDKTTF